MRRRLAFLVLALTAALAGPVALTAAQTPASGGSAATGGTTTTDTPSAPATSDGGGSAPTGVTPAASGANGGNRYGRRFDIPPVVKSFSASPRSVVWGGAPTRLRFRIRAVGALRKVRVRLVAQRAGARALTVNLGRRTTNRTITVRWARAGVAAGSYRLTLQVLDAQGRTLARAASVNLVVKPKPKPKPAPTPAPSNGSGVFPVAGPHSYNDGFGVDRGDHVHQGQDIPASEGTPLVAIRSATVFATGYSASGAGEYVVLYDSANNRSYVYFHLHRRSTLVSEGQSVHSGQRLGLVGSTGDATGPHLHFELWIGRWFDGGHAVDPLPLLRSLDG